MAKSAEMSQSGYGMLVLSGPSGSGKTTLVKRLLMAVPDLRFAISHTTRNRRPGETSGVDYHFVDKSEFLAMIDTHAFVEWAEVHDRYYGTSWAALKPPREDLGTMVLDLDVQGAESVRKRLPGSMSVFIMPPSMRELRRRLMDRESEWTDAMEKRLITAKREMACHGAFDFVVVNDVLENALTALIHIACAVRQLTPRQEERVKSILGEKS